MIHSGTCELERYSYPAADGDGGGDDHVPTVRDHGLSDALRVYAGAFACLSHI